MNSRRRVKPNRTSPNAATLSLVVARDRRVEVEVALGAADRIPISSFVEVVVGLVEIERIDADEPVAAAVRERAGFDSTRTSWLYVRRSRTLLET